MPAPVASRSFFTSAAEIVAMSWVCPRSRIDSDVLAVGRPCCRVINVFRVWIVRLQLYIDLAVCFLLGFDGRFLRLLLARHGCYVGRWLLVRGGRCRFLGGHKKLAFPVRHRFQLSFSSGLDARAC